MWIQSKEITLGKNIESWKLLLSANRNGEKIIAVPVEMGASGADGSLHSECYIILGWGKFLRKKKSWGFFATRNSTQKTNTCTGKKKWNYTRLSWPKIFNCIIKSRMIYNNIGRSATVLAVELRFQVETSSEIMLKCHFMGFSRSISSNRCSGVGETLNSHVGTRWKALLGHDSFVENLVIKVSVAGQPPWAVSGGNGVLPKRIEISESSSVCDTGRLTFSTRLAFRDSCLRLSNRE